MFHGMATNSPIRRRASKGSQRQQTSPDGARPHAASTLVSGAPPDFPGPARTPCPCLDHVVEQVTARRADPHGGKLLAISRSAPVLALYVSARDAAGRPVLALDVAMAGDLHELEDAYPVG